MHSLRFIRSIHSKPIYHRHLFSLFYFCFVIWIRQCRLQVFRKPFPGGVVLGYYSIDGPFDFAFHLNYFPFSFLFNIHSENSGNFILFIGGSDSLEGAHFDSLFAQRIPWKYIGHYRNQEGKSRFCFYGVKHLNMALASLSSFGFNSWGSSLLLCKMSKSWVLLTISLFDWIWLLYLP